MVIFPSPSFLFPADLQIYKTQGLVTSLNLATEKLRDKLLKIFKCNSCIFTGGCWSHTGKPGLKRNGSVLVCFIIYSTFSYSSEHSEGIRQFCFSKGHVHRSFVKRRKCLTTESSKEFNVSISTNDVRIKLFIQKLKKVRGTIRKPIMIIPHFTRSRARCDVISEISARTSSRNVGNGFHTSALGINFLESIYDPNYHFTGC